MDKGESEVMHNQKLLTVIKKDLQATNYPILVLGCVLIGFVSLLMGFGTHPEIINQGIERHLGFMFSMAGIVFMLFIGMFIGISITYFFKPSFENFIKIPSKYEELKNIIIHLGLYVTTLESLTEKKKLGAILYYILKKLPTSQESSDNTSFTIEQAKQIIDDVSFKEIHNQKTLDKSQKTLDEFLS